MRKQNRTLTPKSEILIFVIALLLVIISIHFLDMKIARKVFHFLNSYHFLGRATAHIPDILPYFVLISCLVVWGTYFYLIYSKKNDTNSQFLIIVGTVLPVAYLLKTFFQFAFGRTPTRLWIIYHQKVVFNWFGNFSGGCFPSGHMTVFTALGVAILLSYPKFQKLVLIFLVLLGMALVFTDYHFLSDVIAGAYLGYITTYFIRRLLIN